MVRPQITERLGRVLALFALALTLGCAKEDSRVEAAVGEPAAATPDAAQPLADEAAPVDALPTDAATGEPAAAEESDLIALAAPEDADEADDEPAKEEPADPFAVPAGDADALLGFMAKVQTIRPQVLNYEGYVAHRKKVANALVEAADKLMAGESTDEQFEKAASLKLQALQLLNAAGEETALAQADAFLAKLAKDDRPAIQALVTKNRLLNGAIAFKTLNDEQKAELVAQATDYFAQVEKIDREELQLAMSLGQALEASDEKAAAGLYEKLSPIIAKSENPQIANYGEKMAGIARRLNLPGNPIEVSGTLLDGAEFDWAAQKGKVVLVDFWATWCGPCIAEIPNIKENYAAYHDRGFEVIGISLDENQEAVEAFVEKQEIPWPILFSQVEDQQGWNNPMATRYGIMGIPTAILVDQEGNVVTLEARGPALGEQLAKLIGPADAPDESTTKPAAEGAATDQ